MRGGVVTFLTNILNPTSIWNIMTQSKKQNILYTKTQITCMAMQCLNFFQQMNSNG